MNVDCLIKITPLEQWEDETEVLTSSDRTLRVKTHEHQADPYIPAGSWSVDFCGTVVG